jgi:Lipopolysaccharide kinase (Kdo/WaaP) family
MSQSAVAVGSRCTVPRPSDGYQLHRDGDWQLLVLPEAWSGELQARVLALVNQQVPSKHPQTVAVSWPSPGCKNEYYLKVFHATTVGSAVKDLLRSSKPFRFWRQALALSAAGFNVPQTVAAGELRSFRFVRRGFVLTAKVSGHPLPAFLAQAANAGDPKTFLTSKNTGVRRIAELVRQFHRLGFVHGDLVASNLFIANDIQRGSSVYFMDNDRTHRYPPWMPQTLWKRNLIQLNRMPLPGITLQDRVRFLRTYLGRDRLSPHDRQFARWIESQTRKRRHECDGVDPTVSFRKLLQWNSDISANHDR